MALRKRKVSVANQNARRCNRFVLEVKFSTKTLMRKPPTVLDEQPHKKSVFLSTHECIILYVECLDEECSGALPRSFSCISVIHTRHISSAFSQVLNDRLKWRTSARKKSLLSLLFIRRKYQKNDKYFYTDFCNTMFGVVRLSILENYSLTKNILKKCILL